MSGRNWSVLGKGQQLLSINVEDWRQIVAQFVFDPAWTKDQGYDKIWV